VSYVDLATTKLTFYILLEQKGITLPRIRRLLRVTPALNPYL